MSYKAISITIWLAVIVIMMTSPPNLLYEAAALCAAFAIGTWFPRMEVKREWAVEIRKAIDEEPDNYKNAIKDKLYY